jgi:hypothetical protein
MVFNSVVHQATRVLIEWTPSNNAETLSYRMLQLVEPHKVADVQITATMARAIEGSAY